MHARHVLVLAAALLLISVLPVRADVQIAMQDGRVTLNASQATVREILAAWSKVGQTRIVNAERVSGEPVSLQFQNLPEEEALEIVLRGVSGYLAAPRATALENASRYDRIFVMPTSTAPRATPAPPQPAFPQTGFPQPTFPQPQFNPAIQQPPPFNPDDDDDDQGVNPTLPGPRGPVYTFPPGSVQPQPQMGVVPPGMAPPVRQGPPPARAPVGTAVPGMVVEPPPPAQPANPPAQP